METGDEWWALDKLYHVLFCFLIAAASAALLHRSRYLHLRRWSVSIASMISLTAGVAKEIGDEIGLWKSAGASFKDAVADLVGLFLASFVFSLWRYLSQRRVSGPPRGDASSMV